MTLHEKRQESTRQAKSIGCNRVVAEDTEDVLTTFERLFDVFTHFAHLSKSVKLKITHNIEFQS